MRRPATAQRLVGRAHHLQVTPFVSQADYLGMVEYFLTTNEAFLRGMGVEPHKLPSREAWLERLLPDLARPDGQKQTFYLGWDCDEVRIGHCNVNQLRYGEHAYVHLHLWDAPSRRAGLGTELLRRSIRVFFQRFDLQSLYCEPYAENAAPNRVLTKAGFRFVRRYRTTPGLINFEQEVNRYVMDRAALGDPGNLGA